jgi:hypothetical protein
MVKPGDWNNGFHRKAGERGRISPKMNFARLFQGRVEKDFYKR